MENASKALLMAAGVLIGMILLSLMVYMFTSFAMTSAEIHKGQDENRLNQFNSQFTAYEGKEGITIHDVVTVASLATESNIYNELPKMNPEKNMAYIGVRFRNSNIGGYGGTGQYIEYGYSNNQNVADYNALIQAGLNDTMANGELREYNCTVEISDITGRVYRVTFTAKQ